MAGTNKTPEAKFGNVLKPVTGKQLWN